MLKDPAAYAKIFLALPKPKSYYAEALFECYLYIKLFFTIILSFVK